MNAGVAEKIEPREFVEILDWVEALNLDNLEIKRFKKNRIEMELPAQCGMAAGNRRARRSVVGE